MSAPTALPTDPATDRQREVIAAMNAERGTDLALADSATVGQASALIDRLKALPRLPRDPAANGFYVRDSLLYRVRTSKAGNRYAERYELGDGRSCVSGWKLAGGWAYRLDPEHAIDEVEARAIIREINATTIGERS